ncbi:hypothetical protein OHU45_31265 [Streptomyces tubercidicus]|uniref:hypothetical protein n=1 Tax=Streptomyces tubercidicus TaxID=47759 RepID=UPI002E0EDED2|nr:hypothetical protein OG761_31280 [Streptomyces tubercidicus]WSX19424.1 hypothetical protein OG690_06105 [Streptomyces tubercidicus]
MDSIVLAAGTAVVSAMATEAWQQARTGVVAWWGRVRPDQADGVDAALEESRNGVLAARQAHDISREQALVDDWQVRLHLLVREDPALVGELRRLLDEDLTPRLPVQEQTRVGSIVMKATASGRGRVYQSGADLHVTER